MNSKILLIIAFLCTGLLANAQKTPDKTADFNPPAKKGYYAIGQNQQKLTSDAQGTIVPASRKPVAKGFYAVKGNDSKLPSTTGTVNTKGPVTVQKGYYSIGNNAEKLNRRK